MVSTYSSTPKTGSFLLFVFYSHIKAAVILDGSQFFEAALGEIIVFVNREAFSRVAVLVDGFGQYQGCVLAGAGDVIEIDDLRQESLIGRGLLQDASIGIDDRGTASTPFSNAVDADEITLVEQGVGARHHQFQFAVGGRRKRRL